MKMPWGKFKNIEMDDIPFWYLKWLAEECNDEKICIAADKEYQWRIKNNVKIEDD